VGTYFHGFTHWANHLAKARNGYSRPIANNTIVHWKGEDAIAIQLHATDIITFHRDGRITLANRGWSTITTLQRIRNFSPANLFSERGEWFVQLAPDPLDPEPEWPQRTVPKPFYALDPGPEPVKHDVDCLAGTETVEMETRKVFIMEDDRRDGDVSLPGDHGRYFADYVERWVKVVYQWHEKGYWWHGPPAFENAGEEQHRKQCPHCELFDRQHRAWDHAMNGEGWREHHRKGYRQMVECLAAYSLPPVAENWPESPTRKAWQQAYIEDFRRVRDARREHRAWRERNRVPFEDGIEIDHDGYAVVTTGLEMHHN
jgi:hypothetical protein